MESHRLTDASVTRRDHTDPTTDDCCLTGPVPAKPDACLTCRFIDTLFDEQITRAAADEAAPRWLRESVQRIRQR